MHSTQALARGPLWFGAGATRGTLAVSFSHHITIPTGFPQSNLIREKSPACVCWDMGSLFPVCTHIGAIAAVVIATGTNKLKIQLSVAFDDQARVCVEFQQHTQSNILAHANTQERQRTAAAAA